MRRISKLFLSLIIISQACSDGSGTPLDLGGGPDPKDPTPSTSDVILDFSEFGPGDTITSSQGVAISLAARGVNCADAVIAFDTSDPPGSTGDDLDLGAPNKAFGGPGVGAGGRPGPFQNDRPLGNVLVIQEDPALEDENPSPMDDCDGGGTVVFDFSELSASGVRVSLVTVLDVDNKQQAKSEFRLYGSNDELLANVNPPITKPNGVARMSFDGISGVLRMEVEEKISVAIAEIAVDLPSVEETSS